MGKKRFGLRTKLTLLSLLMAVVICAGACVVGYFTYRSAIYRNYSGFAYQIGETAMHYVDGDHIADYLDSMEADTAYEVMAQQIYALYDRMEITGIYLCVPDPEALTLINIFDSRVFDAPDPSVYALGAVDPLTGNPQATIQVFQTGQRSSSYFIRKSSFGYNASAVLPVKNGAGTVTALMIVDVPIPNINRDLSRYLLLTIAVTALLGAVVLSAVVRYLRHKVVAPITKITVTADRFVRDRNGFSEESLNIHTGDELETLATALTKMGGDIMDYIENLAAVTAEKERIGAELSIATHIQSSMLPCIFPAFPDRSEFDIYATMDPAKEVGGDFYDFFMVDKRHLAIVMADVSGKGVPAALFMVIGKTLIKDHTQPGTDLGTVFSEVNDLLCQSNSEGMFITAFEGVLDLLTGEFVFVNAGHEIPFISKAGSPFAPHKIRAGFVLAGLEGIRYRCGSMKLDPGDKVFQYTDGVTEATDKDHQLYGMERLERVLAENSSVPPLELLPAVKADIDTFVGEAPQFDDITMLCLEFRHYMNEEPNGSDS